MKKIVGFLLVILTVALMAPNTTAQINRKSIKKNNKRMRNFKGKKNFFDKRKKYNYIGITLNSFNYFGDLSPLPSKLSTDIGFTRPAIGVTFGHRFGPRYTLRAEFRYGALRGSDFESADPNDPDARFRYVRNLHFRNRIKELSVTGMFDLYKNSSTYINRVQLTPYAFAGVTLFHHNPQAKVGSDGPASAGKWVDLRPLGTEGQNLDLPAGHPNAGNSSYSQFQIAIPFGLGVRYKLNEVLDFSFEMAIRYTFTDYLDDVSGVYVNIADFNDPLAAYLSDRSREVADAESGTERFGSTNGASEIFNNRTGPNGTIPGYGSFNPNLPNDNIRGNSNDNDFYFVTTFRLSYVLGGSFRKAKFR